MIWPPVCAFVAFFSAIPEVLKTASKITSVYIFDVLCICYEMIACGGDRIQCTSEGVS